MIRAATRDTPRPGMALKLGKRLLRVGLELHVVRHEAGVGMAAWVWARNSKHEREDAHRAGKGHLLPKVMSKLGPKRMYPQTSTFYLPSATSE